MTDFTSPFGVLDARRAQRPHLAIPHQTHNHTGAQATSFITAEADRLIAHPHFELYSPISRDLLAATDQHWYIFLILRSMLQATFFGRHYASVYYTPPPDIFNIIAHIRNDGSWQNTRREILIRIDHACQQSRSSRTMSDGSRHRPPQGDHLTPDTARSRSRPSQVRSSQSHQQGQPRSEYQTSSLGGGPSTAGSPTPAEGHLAAFNAGRTAPDGHLFYCPSKNCRRSYPRQGYTRQGHYENHMRDCHAEWESHDSFKSLREIPGQEHAHAADQSGDPMTLGDSALPMTPQPIFANSTPHTPIPSSDLDAEYLSLHPDTVFEHIIQSAGTEPQISVPLFGLLEETLSTMTFPTNLTGVPQSQYDAAEGQHHLFQTPSSQTSSNLNHSYWSPDSFMDGQ